VFLVFNSNVHVFNSPTACGPSDGLVVSNLLGRKAVLLLKREAALAKGINTE
jgi:hypothetical protein